MARDRGGPRITQQLLHVPMLDDRLDTPSMRRFESTPGFNRTQAEGMRHHYLGEDADRTDTSPYAAPAVTADSPLARHAQLIFDAAMQRALEEPGYCPDSTRVPAR
jgi:acetyl esterase/lipase